MKYFSPLKNDGLKQKKIPASLYPNDCHKSSGVNMLGNFLQDIFGLK